MLHKVVREERHYYFRYYYYHYYCCCCSCYYYDRFPFDRRRFGHLISWFCCFFFLRPITLSF